MTVRVERTVAVDAAPADVWAVLADPANRARAISAVDDYEITGEGTATWHIRVPIPLVRRTVAVETEELERDPPHGVRFVGRSAVMDVEGEHRIESSDGGSLVHTRFTVDGRVPGVERYFERTVDREFANVEAALGAVTGR